MKIEKFEEIKAWQLARELTQKIYQLSNKQEFSRDRGLREQIRRAAGSSMHNIGEGFDSESNAEFIRFLRYAKRSCTEVQSQLYIALDEGYILTSEFDEAYDLANKTRATIRGFINYLTSYQKANNGKNKFRL